MDIAAPPISSRRIADLMVSFIESGFSNFWCTGVSLESPGDVAPDDPHKGPWYDNPRRYEDPDLRLKIEVDGETDHFIGVKEIADGLTKLAADPKYAHHFADIVGENDDANTADIAIQFIVFGEEVYA